MRRLAGAAREAIGGGRFVSGWSIAIAALISLTVMAPIAERPWTVVQVVASLGSTLVFLAILVAIGAAERATDATTRIIIVGGGLLVAPAARPLAHAALLALLGGPELPAWQLPFRFATNLAVWTVALTAIAVIVTHVQRLRATNARLRTVMAGFDRAGEYAVAFGTSARALVGDVAARLRLVIDAIPSGARAAESVRELGAVIREWSHTVAARAGEAPPAPDLQAVAPRHSRTLPLRLPPVGVVAALYVACVLPFAIRTSSIADLLWGLGAIALGTALVDGLPRRVRLSRVSPSAAFLTLSSFVGLGLAALAVAQGVPPSLAVVSALVYPALAAATAVCSGTIHALTVEQRRLSAAVSAAQRASRDGTRDARDALHDAAGMLHREGQGRCAIFALASSTRPADVERLRDELSALADQLPTVFTTARPHASAASIDSVIATWQPVIDVRAEVTPEARRYLDSAPSVAADAFEVVAEGLLNAVKHSRPPVAAVTVDLVTTGAGPRVRVKVASPGALPPGAALRTDSAAYACGARLRQDATGALLEAVLSAARVVSAEHPGGEADVGE